MGGPLVVTNFASAVVWTLCGLMLADPLVTGPNVFCAVASAFCIFLRVRYPPAEETGKLDAESKLLDVVPKKPKMEALPFAKAKKAVENYGGVPPCCNTTSDGTGGTF